MIDKVDTVYWIQNKTQKLEEKGAKHVSIEWTKTCKWLLLHVVQKKEILFSKRYGILHRMHCKKEKHSDEISVDLLCTEVVEEHHTVGKIDLWMSDNENALEL